MNKQPLDPTTTLIDHECGAPHNMYGCLPCPKCGLAFRVAYRYDYKFVVECDDCGYRQVGVLQEGQTSS